jgi:hypothetical protein
MSRSRKGEHIGIVPSVKSTPMFQSIPEDKLQINRKYLIEINKKASPLLTIKKKYKGVLDTLKSEKSIGSYKFEYYKFKYLECLNKNDINESEERIDGPIFMGRNKLAFLKIYNASAGEDILTLDQIKAMEEIDHKKGDHKKGDHKKGDHKKGDHKKGGPEIGLVEGNTYYVRYIDPSGDDLSNHNAFRGKYVGIIKRKGHANEYCFSNKINISKSVFVDESIQINFFYTAKDLIEYDRQRRVFDALIPYGQSIVGSPSKKRGGNKRKTEKQKRKSNKRKTEKRFVNMMV